MSGNVTRDAAREALAIATGLPRAQIDQRAQQAFDSANDTRARLRGLPDTAKRAHATARARTWADILRHMDQTGEGEFCGHPCDNTPPPARERNPRPGLRNASQDQSGQSQATDPKKRISRYILTPHNTQTASFRFSNNRHYVAIWPYQGRYSEFPVPLD